MLAHCLPTTFVAAVIFLIFSLCLFIGSTSPKQYMKLNRWHMRMIDQRKIKWILYIILVLVVLLTLQFEIKVFSSLSSFFMSVKQQPLPRYVIVMDAGSTGTRMHIYKFNIDSGGLPALESEFKKRTKPGLSIFLNRLQKVTNIISHLLGIAKEYIPFDMWNKTSLILFATAGLRTLPDDDAKSILNEVHKVFDQSPFQSNNESVSLLEGEQEGVYAWYSLNFLLERLDNAKNTAALIDLGGESLQTTFWDNSLPNWAFKDNNLLTKLQQKPSALYSQSYLGIGLMNARISLARIIEVNKIAVMEHDNKITFASPCLHPNEKEFWELGFEGLFKNESYKKYGFENCYAIALEYLGNIINKPFRAQEDVYALSSHLLRAYELGLIESEGGNCTVNAFVDACKFSCNNLNSFKMFICVDCSYISAIWQHGLQLEGDKEIKFVRKIRGIEPQWTLGAAFHILMNK